MRSSSTCAITNRFPKRSRTTTVPTSAPKHIAHEGDRGTRASWLAPGMVIHDAQYTPEEYPSKKNWGHSTYEYAVDMAAAAGVRDLALTHHDPAHDDAFIAQVENRARAYAKQRGHASRVCCAYEGLDVVGRTARRSAILPDAPSAPQSGAGRKPRRPYPGRGRRTGPAHPREPCAQPGRPRVVEASSGQEALALIDAAMPDLVLLDLLMPKQGGMEVLRILRSRPATATLPVIVLTGMDDESDHSRRLRVRRNRLPDQAVFDPAARRARTCLSDPHRQRRGPDGIDDRRRRDHFAPRR